MNHITFIHLFSDAPGKITGIVSTVISGLSASFAFISFFKEIQPIAALFASCVAIVAGGYAIHCHRLQVKKTRLEIKKLQDGK